MKPFLTAAFLFASAASFAQRTVDVDKFDGLPMNAFYTINGNPVTNFKFVRLTEGSPFFTDTWLKGVVIADNDKRYRSDQMKLNLVDNEVHFLNQKKEEFVCTFSLKEILMTDSINNRQYHFVHSSHVPALYEAKKGWYLLQVEGKASLYQRVVKTLQEVKPYNSAVAEQKIYTSSEFVVVHNGMVLKVKKPKELLAVLGDGNPELEKFIQSDAVKNGNVADQMATIVKYYSGLP